jgi:hypothetical protein
MSHYPFSQIRCLTPTVDADVHCHDNINTATPNYYHQMDCCHDCDRGDALLIHVDFCDEIRDHIARKRVDRFLMPGHDIPFLVPGEHSGLLQ